MYLDLIIPPENSEPAVIETDAEGRVIKLRIPVSFYNPDASGPVVYLNSVDRSEKSLCRKVASLSGRNGQVRVVDRTRGTVEPFLYRSKRPKKADPAPPANDPADEGGDDEAQE